MVLVRRWLGSGLGLVFSPRNQRVGSAANPTSCDRRVTRARPRLITSSRWPSVARCSTGATFAWRTTAAIRRVARRQRLSDRSRGDQGEVESRRGRIVARVVASGEGARHSRRSTRSSRSHVGRCPRRRRRHGYRCRVEGAARHVGRRERHHPVLGHAVAKNAVSIHRWPLSIFSTRCSRSPGSAMACPSGSLIGTVCWPSCSSPPS